MDGQPVRSRSSPAGTLELTPERPSVAGVLVRAATVDDVDPLVALRRVAGGRAYASLGRDAVARWLVVRANHNHVAALLDDVAGQLFVATAGDLIVGMAFVRRESRRVARLSDLYCDPPRIGAGSALLEARIAWARARGAALVRCSVFAANMTAQRFFNRQGFTVTGTELSEVIPGALLLRHERSLR
jgi:GNAT superfamily N-acetyltransferase